MNLRNILKLPPILEVKNVLCVQAHPDDNEIGAGGFLSILKAKGAKITFVTVTDGRKGLPTRKITHDEIVKIRDAEKRKAGEILGVTEFIDLGFEDGGNYTIDSLIEKLVGIFRTVKPELVLTVDGWAPYEAHPDHEKTGKGVAAAILAARNLSLSHLGETFSVPQIAFYATAYPNTYIDITNYWDNKIRAIKEHKSQFDNPNWPFIYKLFYEQSKEWYKEGVRKRTIKITESEFHEEGLAEAFKVLFIWELHMFPNTIFS